jgi:hypothetical protein
MQICPLLLVCVHVLHASTVFVRSFLDSLTQRTVIFGKRSDVLFGRFLSAGEGEILFMYGALITPDGMTRGEDCWVDENCSHVMLLTERKRATHG